MFWKEKKIQIDGGVYDVYHYFYLHEKSILNTQFYNSETKQIEYPAKYELLTKSRLARSEEEFLQYYYKNRGF